MITSCHIKNFKCFEDIEISGLKRINLITGENNVGKTALLEALFMFANEKPSIITSQYFSRGLDKVEARIETACTPIFYNYDNKRSIEIELEISDVIEKAVFVMEDVSESESSDHSLPVNQDDKQLSIKIIRNNEIIHQSTLYTKDNKFTRKRTISNPRTVWYIIKNDPLPTNEMAKMFSLLASENREKEICEIVQYFEPRLKGLKLIVEGATPVIHCNIDPLPRTIPVNFVGDGFVKLLGLCMVVMSSSKEDCNVILVDEIENGLHHSILTKFWETLSGLTIKHNCQLFATTHSYEMVQAAWEGTAKHKDDFNFLRLDMDKNNRITAKQSDYEMIEAAIETNLEVR